MTQTGDANFTLTSATSWTVISWKLVFQGTGTINNASGATRLIAALTVANSGKTTTYSSTNMLSSRKLTIGAGVLTISSYFWIQANAIAAYVFDDNHTINGTAAFNPALGSASAITMNMPRINASGLTGDIYMDVNFADSTWNLQGPIVTGGTLRIYGAGRSAIITTNNNNITCGALVFGTTVTGTTTYNIGSSTLTLSSFNTTSYTIGCILNLGTSTWVVTGSFALGSNTTTNNTDTCLGITFNSTPAANITSAGKTLPDLIFNKTTGLISLLDSVTCNSFTVIGTNTSNITWAGYTLTTILNCTLGGTGTYNVGTGITCTDSTSTLTFASTIITLTSSSCILTLSGNFVLNITATFSRLIMNKVTTRTITVAATKTLTLTNLTDTNLNGSVGALTQWRSGTPNSSFNVTIPAPITLTYQNPQDCAISQNTTVSDGTSLDGGGNNTNWIWPSLSKNFYLTYLLLKRMSTL
jgi:hypothetical protein